MCFFGCKLSVYIYSRDQIKRWAKNNPSKKLVIERLQKSEVGFGIGDNRWIFETKRAGLELLGHMIDLKQYQNVRYRNLW